MFGYVSVCRERGSVCVCVRVQQTLGLGEDDMMCKFVRCFTVASGIQVSIAFC